MSELSNTCIAAASKDEPVASSLARLSHSSLDCDLVEKRGQAERLVNRPLGAAGTQRPTGGLQFGSSHPGWSFQFPKPDFLDTRRWKAISRIIACGVPPGGI